ncbi:hypothetical protein D1227_01620 [Henriciella mobilis]|uniref:hypothetical protein n=1 Tax=Henriciella mobilis TaxID=2305467 RepID=UPI000E6626A3|nr:hypothetical protein [Henriciella mobilis]RIJ18112.1 hypothetical protein D1231_02035 [Henriciella mobilis]RIJ25080.1 hypothetical protein D1227_01620 [Henriciella mobilis]
MADIPLPNASHRSGAGLTRAQIGRLAAIGVIVWFLGALALRFLAPLGIYDGLGRVVLYVLMIPALFPVIYFLPQLAGISRNKIALGTSFATAAAVMMDGLALAWFPVLYGDTTAHHAGAGAAILWGGGAGIFLAFLLNRAQ